MSDLDILRAAAPLCTGVLCGYAASIWGYPRGWGIGRRLAAGLVLFVPVWTVVRIGVAA